MKTGKTLSALAMEIERQADSKKDYVVDTRNLAVRAINTEIGGDPAAKAGVVLAMRNGKEMELPLRVNAHHQIAERIGVPQKYYDRMLTEAPALLARNVNHWFAEQPEPRMVRTLDGHARAFLSNRYQRIDNLHVAEVVLPVLQESSRDLHIVSCEVTDAKLYIKAIDRSITAQVKGSRRVGDFVEAGIMVTNSEVGLGAVSVTPFMHFLACLNGMVLNKQGMRAAHLGTRLDVDETIAALLADDTRKVLDQGVLLKVRDTVRALLDPQAHQARVDAMSEQTGQKLQGDPAASIELLADDFQLAQPERTSVLRHLIEGGDLSRYGLMNAVTRTAEDAESYDRATEIEAMGGRILTLPADSWQRLAVAA